MALGRDNKEKTTGTKVLDFVTDFYLGSRDFNGVPVGTIEKEMRMSRESILRALRELLGQNHISIVSSKQDVNPYIKRFAEESRENQIIRFDSEDGLICVYPSPTHLHKVVDRHSFEGKPFTLKIALGAPQLDFESFDLRVLLNYRDDPRYDYYNNDIHGSIDIKDDETIKELDQSDRVFLKSFGYSYDSEHYRAVAVFLIYLRRLNAAHQQIWNAKLLRGEYKLHPDYYRSMILGEWPEGCSVVDALSLDIIAINQVCKLMKRPPLFNDELRVTRATELSFLIMPTRKEFCKFALELNKAIGDNINIKFFRDDVEKIKIIKTRSGPKEQNKGSVELLAEWLEKCFHIDDRTQINEMIKCFKNIAKLRGRAAHTRDENKYNRRYFKEQRDLFIEAYTGINLLRIIFASYPRAKKKKIPPSLNGKVYAE
jgi:hypothetical protein